MVNKWIKDSQDFTMDHLVASKNTQDHNSEEEAEEMVTWNKNLCSKTITINSNTLQILWEVQDHKLPTINITKVVFKIKWVLLIKIDFSTQMKLCLCMVVARMITWKYIHKIYRLKCYQ